MPRLLYSAVSLRPGTGGIGRVARLIARVLVEQHQRGLVVAGLTLADRAPPPDLALPVQTLAGQRWRFTLAALIQGWRSSHLLFDACHLAQVTRLAPLRGKPTLTFLHGIEVWEKAPRRYVQAARRSTFLLANSEFTRSKVERLHGGFDHARVCWLATEADEPPTLTRGSHAGPPEVLCVGRLVPDRPKGHRELLAAWPTVVAAVPDAVLRIVGDGPDAAALRQLASASPAAKNIIMQGFVTDAELEGLYSRAMAFAMPSRGEGFGLVYIEAMRHGLPVLASCHDAAPEVVVEGQTGVIVDLDQPGELAERLVDLLRDRDQAARLGSAGRQRWQDHFRFSAFRKRFLPLLQEFLGLDPTRVS